MEIFSILGRIRNRIWSRIRSYYQNETDPEHCLNGNNTSSRLMLRVRQISENHNKSNSRLKGSFKFQQKGLFKNIFSPSFSQRTWNGSTSLWPAHSTTPIRAFFSSSMHRRLKGIVPNCLDTYKVDYLIKLLQLLD